MLTDEELTEQLERSRQRADENTQRLQRNAQARAAAREQIATIIGTAETADGALRASVGPGGVLTKLEAVSGTGPLDQQLADEISNVIHQAVADANTQIGTVYENLLNEGVIRELPATLQDGRQGPLIRARFGGLGGRSGCLRWRR